MIYIYIDDEEPQHQMQLKICHPRMGECELLVEILGHNNGSHCQLFPRLVIESSPKAWMILLSQHLAVADS